MAHVSALLNGQDVIELGKHAVALGDCVEVMRGIPAGSVDAIVTDPPYGLGFMGKEWDALPPGPEWAEQCLRVLRPGGHVVAFGGTRTVHRLAVALEDAGFEIRDTIHWCYWSGFPKSLDVSKAIDKAAGAKREVVGRSVFHSKRPNAGAGVTIHMPAAAAITAPATEAAKTWQGWGTALKPSVEPAVLARKPMTGTVADCVQEHGTGALNIDACRIAPGDKAWPGPSDDGDQRWPANLYHCPKPSTSEREAGTEGRAADGERGNTHPTVKPIRLMQWLVRLVTRPGGVVLEPFAGSGTTLLAAEIADIGAQCVAIEREPEYVEIIRERFGAREVLRRILSGPVSQPERDALAVQISLFGDL